MYPIFINDLNNTTNKIASLPGQYNYSSDTIVSHLKPLINAGLQSIILFGVLSNNNNNLKDNYGTYAIDENNPVRKAIRNIKEAYPNLVVAADVCLCTYTNHGHCGIINPDNNNNLNNIESIKQLTNISKCYIDDGVDIIAPSDMNDNRILSIKNMLININKQHEIPIMSYSAKYASNMYGPFRDAACSGTQFGDRSKYQLPITSTNLAKRAIIRDIKEGADIIMIKPGLPYLDILNQAKEISNVPLAIYQVSGEYRMLYYAAKHGALDLKQSVLENFYSHKRAGANLILSYYTPFFFIRSMGYYITFFY